MRSFWEQILKAQFEIESCFLHLFLYLHVYLLLFAENAYVSYLSCFCTDG